MKSSTDDDKLLIKNVDVEDLTGADDETQPTDTLKVTFDVSNALTTELKNVKIRAWVEDSTGKRFSDRSSTESFDLAEKYLSEGNEFELVVSEDAKKSTSVGSYYLVKLEASGESDDGTTRSDIYFKEFKVFREDHKVIIENVAVLPESGTCGSGVEFAITATNIGNTEESVKLSARNAVLSTNVDSGTFTLKKDGSEQSKITKLTINVPANAKADSYPFDVKAIYNDGKSDVVVSKALPVTCAATIANANATSAISVAQGSQTVSRGEAGKYTITLTNTQATQQTFKVSVTGVADWGTVTVENGEVTLMPSASAPAYIYVTPNSDAAAGLHLATVAINAGSTLLDTKTLTTTVAVPTTTVTDYSRSATAASTISNSTLMNVGFAALFIVVVALAVGLFWVRNGKSKTERY